MKPNVVLVHAHDLGTCAEPFGGAAVPAPRLAQLVAEGTSFDRCYAAHPTCSPSRAALFTGRTPHATGVLGLTHEPFGWALNGDEVHLAAMLGARGYRTTLIGGFHEHPWHDAGRLGYDEIISSVPLEEAGGFRPAAEVATEVERWLGHHRSHGEPDTAPFFLSVGLFEPHRPFDYGGVTPAADDGDDVPPFIPTDTPARRRAAAEEWGAYRAAVAEMDRAVGRILDALSANDTADDTVVVFTSDHGVAFPRAKGTLTDAGIGIPLVLRGPGIPSGRRVPDLCGNTDLVPTLLHLIDGTPPAPGGGGNPAGDGPPLQGVSHLERLRDDRAACARTAVFAEKNFHEIYDPIRAIRTERYKLIVNLEHGPLVDVPNDVARGAVYRESAADLAVSRPPYELYDLATDPGETDNRSGDPALWEVEADLRRRLVGWMERTGDFVLDGPPRSVYNQRRVAELLSIDERA